MGSGKRARVRSVLFSQMSVSRNVIISHRVHFLNISDKAKLSSPSLCYSRSSDLDDQTSPHRMI